MATSYSARPGKRPGLLALSVSPWRLIAAFGGIAAVVTVLGFFGSLWWIFDLFSHFRVQLLAGLVLLSALLLVRREIKSSIALAIFAGVNLGTIVPLYVGQAPIAADDSFTHRALLANVNTRSGKPELLVQVIEQFKPDIIVLEEVDEAWLSALQQELAAYPHTEAAPRADNFGIALYSRYPIRRGEIIYVGDAEVPSVIAEIESPAGVFTVIGTHPVPPGSAENSRLRDGQLAQLPELVRNASSPVLLLGDLNVTPWSYAFRRLVRESGLRDSSRGRGVQPTWPTFMPLFWIPIDHCLYGAGIQVTDKIVGPGIGSDHYPLIVNFVLEQSLEQSQPGLR
jgi:endonuclease/exonuclease/phosphatase (EEP) superfamily protein YafD